MLGITQTSDPLVLYVYTINFARVKKRILKNMHIHTCIKCSPQDICKVMGSLVAYSEQK